MNRKLWLCLAALLAAANAQATIINFDDMDCDYLNTRPDSYYFMPAGYGRLTWNGFSCANASMKDQGGPDYIGSGYGDGVQSPRNLIAVDFVPPSLPDDGLTGSIEAPAGGSFDLNSLYITPVWHDNLKVTITGFRNGAAVYPATTHTLRTGSPHFLNLQFANVDKVVFQSVANSGAADTRYFSNPFLVNIVGRIFALDTLDVTLHLPPEISAVPATSTGTLAALSGVLGVAGVLAARRRKRAA